MRLVPSLAVLAALAVPSAAMASTIFGSGISTVTYVNAGTGTAVPYTGTTPYSLNNYTAPAAGTVYVTYDNSTEYLPGGLTSYSTTFSGLAGRSGTVSFAADDSVVVFLNGILIGSSNTFGSLTTVNFTTLAGSNILRFDVTNNPQAAGAANPTALDFGGSAATPEPSSLALLGTGMFSIAGMARRRFRKA